jgi:hypothetical protein
LANFPTTSGGGASVSYYLNGSVSQGTFGGIAMREINKVPIIGAGTDFTINANGYIQSFITDANDPNQLEIPSGNWNFETYFSASSNGGNPSFYVELYKWDGATLTLIASNSTNPEIITGGTATDLYLTALAVPQTTLALTDRLVVRIYVTHSGRTIKLHTEDNHLSQIITTFSTGLTSLNGITAQVQNLAVGTSGTDFAISSATDTHTFNLPTASATNRGALSTSDWSAFNGKQAALVSGTNIKTINGTTLLGSGDITVGGGITVGTTAVTSGTDTRVFFQQGGVVQQDANFTFNNTQKRLTLKAVGATASDIPFVVRNSADTANLFTLSGNNQFSLANSVTSDGFTTYLGTPSGVTQITASGNGLTLTSNYSTALNATNNTSIQTNGTTRIYCNNAGNVGIGSATTLGARLDVRAQGALSTDIAFRVRNSADSATIGYIAGNGLIVLGENASTAPTVLVNPSGSTRLLLRGGTNQDLSFSSSGFALLNCAQGFDAVAGSAGSSQIRLRNGSGGNVSLFYGGLQIGTAQSASTATNFTLIANGVAPSVNYADSHYYYSADIVAGNAAPHFRTEAGDIIKLYKETTAVTAATFVTNTSAILNDTATFDGYTIGQVVKALRNLGILA